MSLTIHLLGRPTISGQSGDEYQFRSRKSWALLAYLLLTERPPSRTELASLLFSEADDPLRALRWSLAEVRRGLGHTSVLHGDPVIVTFPPGATVDVNVLVRGNWREAIALPGIGGELLSGIAIARAPAFESWLLSEQRYVAAASEAIVHEAALATMAEGEYQDAIRYAVQLVAMNPLDENHQATLIRLYRLMGDSEAADRQLAACTELFARELGVSPGPALLSASREPIRRTDTLTDAASIGAIIEAGSAAVAAGAVEEGVRNLRSAVAASDVAEIDDLRVTARLLLAESLIHSLRGMDEEGSAALHEVVTIGESSGHRTQIAQARAELGYVDFLRARYDRAERWLADAFDDIDPTPALSAQVSAYQGSIESDRADYAAALNLLDASIGSSQAIGDIRREAYAQSMAGRVHLLRGDYELAADRLDTAVELSEKDRWLAFLPWPQALQGEVDLARANPSGAIGRLSQAFARACQLGDPCWEGMSARGLALAKEAMGNPDEAFEILADARSRCNRLADPYVWLDAYILDAQCELGRKHGHPDTKRWIEALHEVASRSGMKELLVRSLLHGAALGNEGDAAAAHLLGSEIDNPVLANLLTV